MSSIPASQCSFEFCEKELYANQLCNAHYNQKRLGKVLSPVKNYQKKINTFCSFEQCDRETYAKTYCFVHYLQFRKNGKDSLALIRAMRDRTPGQWSPWKLNSYGYVYRQRYFEKRRELELQHRYIMEIYLGRKLLPHENVHHKNGQRDDNRLDNLELWSVSQPKGQRVEDKIFWAIEFLEENGYTVIDKE